MSQDYMQTPVAVAAIGKAQVDIARLEIQVEHLMASVNELKKSNAGLEYQLQEITKLLSEARGGWHVMMWLGGACATLGGVITWAIQHLRVAP